jgi:3'-phosphoadenosine 5'-phosphosulfate sulfotransferase (PAPS reductase)/FAD synthetase
MKYIATISFGKDSTVMCDLLLKNGYPVDYIVFKDTLMEFPFMYEYKEKVCKYFKERYNREVIVTKPETTFEHWCFGVIKDKTADKHGYIRGIPMVWALPCYWQRESKVKPQNKLFDEILGDEETTSYIGFTLDESTRKMSGDGNFLYPLIDDFKMTERNCQEYLINQEMQNPLYNFFTRTGCAICPAQSEEAWFQVWKNFKDTWEYMKWIETRLLQYERMGMKVSNSYWFTDYRTCEDMEKKFIKAEKQKTLMDFSDEPLKDCFCKI